MKTQNKWLTLDISGNTLHVTNRQSGGIKLVRVRP